MALISIRSQLPVILKMRIWRAFCFCFLPLYLIVHGSTLKCSSTIDRQCPLLERQFLSESGF